MEEEKRRHDNLFNLRYHQDMTDRTEVQGMLRELREQQDATRSQNEARNAVLGGTKEQQIAEEQGVNKAYADSVAQIASNSSMLKDGYLDAYENNLSNYYQQKRAHNTTMAGIDMNQSNQWSTTADNALKLAGAGAGVAAGGISQALGANKAPAAQQDAQEAPAGATPNKIKMAGPATIGDNGMQMNPDGTITNPKLNPIDRINQQWENMYKFKGTPTYVNLPFIRRG